MRKGSRASSTAVDLDVRVAPRAGRSEVAGMRHGALLIRLAAAPVDGAANAQLIDLIARALHLPKRDVTIVGGERSRTKRVRVAGMNREQALACLAGAAEKAE